MYFMPFVSLEKFLGRKLRTPKKRMPCHVKKEQVIDIAGAISFVLCNQYFAMVPEKADGALDCKATSEAESRGGLWFNCEK